jgi:CxxC motif-containing protein (DUF1111 family)
MWILWLGVTGAAEGPDPVVLGRELFVRTWEPYDPRTGGDGLGPMFNATSCVACHALGGVGGAGGSEHDVLIALTSPGVFEVQHRGSTLGTPRHSGQVSRRNTPALFGAGLVDTIPESALHQAAEVQARSKSGVSGRVSLLPDGRLGRFGWKAHSATLTDFVGTACAVELGLEVPGHMQGLPPPGDLHDRATLITMATDHLREQYDLPSQVPLDLTATELASLTTFVASLPPPQERTEQPSYARGGEIFQDIGCAGCHLPTLGGVEGIYSDLLLHDLGGAEDRASSYGLRTRGEPVAKAVTGTVLESLLSSPSATEWRTPPLWGVASSAPYWHDGRAVTLDAAILAHQGEATATRNAYMGLEHLERLALTTFLESLVAPGT